MDINVDNNEVIEYLIEENNALYEVLGQQDKILTQSIQAQRELVNALNLVVDNDLRALSDRIVSLSESLFLAESLIGFAKKDYC